MDDAVFEFIWLLICFLIGQRSEDELLSILMLGEQ